MRALRLHRPAPVGDRPLRLEDVPVPRPQRGEVLVRIAACGICRTDLHVVEGELPVRRSPVVPGHQIVGVLEQAGAGVALSAGARIGVAWLHRTCGTCRFCRSGRENLCEHAAFTGWDRDGGYADAVTARADVAVRLPDGYPDLAAAPLLCGGVIGYRSLRVAGIGPDSAGARLGLYGFGASEEER